MYVCMRFRGTLFFMRDLTDKGHSWTCKKERAEKYADPTKALAAAKSYGHNAFIQS